jgi:tight adherence protein C
VLLLLLGVASLGLAAFLIGEVATMPARQRVGAIRRAASYGSRRRPAGPEPGAKDEGFRERALGPLSTNLARGVLRLSPRSTIESINVKLLSAGLGRTVSPTTYLAAKGMLAGGGFVAGAVLTAAIGKSVGGSLLLTLLCAFMGFSVPDIWLTMRARARKERIRSELPDALDLLAVSVEAGMGFDGAIAKLTEHMEGPLSDEFALTLGEMRIGESRQEALKKMAQRVDTPELAAFSRAIIQADQLGISLGRILKVQAQDTRNRRQAAAEERAMKAPIKMLFPTVVFIFPAMFLVILGPAFLNLAELF